LKATSNTSLESTRNLLLPSVGVVVFHLYVDIHYDYIYSRIVSVFGESQVAVFNVSSVEVLVVAGRELFRIPSHLQPLTSFDVHLSGNLNTINTLDDTHLEPLIHPCEEPLDAASYAEKFALNFGVSDKIRLGGRYALNCNDKLHYVSV
jgi:hypothetical protein